MGLGTEEEKKVTFLQFLFSGACSGHSEIRGDESQKSEKKKVAERNKREFLLVYYLPRRTRNPALVITCKTDEPVENPNGFSAPHAFFFFFSLSRIL